MGNYSKILIVGQYYFGLSVRYTIMLATWQYSFVGETHLDAVSEILMELNFWTELWNLKTALQFYGEYSDLICLMVCIPASWSLKKTQCQQKIDQMKQKSQYEKETTTNNIANAKPIPSISVYSVGGACDSWWGGPGLDSRCGRPLPTGWVGVSIMWPAETEVMVSRLCLMCGRK